MDNFVGLGRKLRSAAFNSGFGPGAFTNTLKNSIRNKHLAQAFLFFGSRGVGKKTFSRILA